MTLFEQVKGCVTARQAAEHYGIKVKGNGMACCPFHKDRHPSMKADKIYHCFACGVGGDAIDFTARLFGISQYEAAKKLIEDFGLDIKVGNRSKYERTPRNRAILKRKQSKVVMIREKLEQWLKHATDVLIRYLKWIQFWKEFYKPEPEEEWHELFTEALANERKINDYLDVLMFGTGEEIVEFFKMKRREVEKLKKELTNISEKSLMELEDIVNEEMLTTEDVNDMLEHTDKGRTKQTIRNCVTVLQKDPVLKKAIKRNELSGRMDIVKEVPWERRNNSPTVTDTDENNLKMYLEENYELTSERVIKAGVDIVSNENKYHPIRDYLESLVWDGIPRIENMLPHFLGAEKSNYTVGVMKMHMVAAISRIYEPGIKYDIMLCLVGSQGAGKSTFFKYLAIKEEWFSDNLDHLDDENIYRKLQNHWIIEMGEMKATVTAKNIEQIKSFLSRQKETYKVPYEVHPEDRPRQCVFCGTSNDLNFLPLDRTGNRRFAPVMTDMSKAEVHILDNEAESKAYIEQAWAEAMVLYRQGNVFLGFTKEIEEEAKRLQKEFMPEDTNAGIIQAFLDDYDDDYVCTRILFDEALHRTGEMKQWEGKEIANIMNNAIVGWKPHGTHRFGKEYGIQRSWKRMEESVKKDKDGFVEVPEQLEIPFE